MAFQLDGQHRVSAANCEHALVRRSWRQEEPTANMRVAVRRVQNIINCVVRMEWRIPQVKVYWWMSKAFTIKRRDFAAHMHERGWGGVAVRLVRQCETRAKYNGLCCTPSH